MLSVEVIFVRAGEYVDSSNRSIKTIEKNQSQSGAAQQAQELEKITLEANIKDKKIGQILIDQGLISLRQLTEALMAQQELERKQKKKLKIGEILLFSEIITLAQLQGALRNQTQKMQMARREAELTKKKMEAARIEREKRAEMLKEEYGMSMGDDDLNDDPNHQSFVQRFVKKFKF